MSNENSNTGRSGGASGDHLRELCEHIAAILSNPETPEEMHTDLVEYIHGRRDAAFNITDAPELYRILARDAKGVKAGQEDAGAEPAEARSYQPITWQRAKEIGELLINHDDDDQCAMFLELLNGLAYAHFHRDDRTGADFESIIIEASHSAYAQTMDFSDTIDRFALSHRGVVRQR